MKKKINLAKTRGKEVLIAKNKQKNGGENMASKILLIDDDKDLVEELTIRFSAEGYETVKAHSGEEGLKAAAETTPDLIIMDVMMPQMDGYTAFRVLKAQYKDRGQEIPPVIILTGKDMVKELFEVEGVDDYIVKPFHDQDLIIRVKRALKKRGKE